MENNEGKYIWIAKVSDKGQIVIPKHHAMCLESKRATRLSCVEIKKRGLRSQNMTIISEPLSNMDFHLYNQKNQ